MPYLPESKRLKPDIHAIEDFLYEMSEEPPQGEKITLTF